MLIIHDSRASYKRRQFKQLELDSLKKLNESILYMYMLAIIMHTLEIMWYLKNIFLVYKYVKCT